jgi:hypothetical protein
MFTVSAQPEFQPLLVPRLDSVFLSSPDELTTQGGCRLARRPADVIKPDPTRLDNKPWPDACRQAVPHALRATFRDWAGEESYRRGNGLKRWHALMQDWADHLS